MRPRPSRLVVRIAALLMCGCGGSPAVGPTPTPTPTPSPTPSGLPGVVIGARTGVTQITLADASPLPGATLAGCEATATGCAGRIKVSLDLLSPTGGPVIGGHFFLHSSGTRACLIGRMGAFELAPGTSRRIEIVLDQGDECGTPTDIRTAAATVEGPNGIAARQEWGVLYTLGR
jgi:hypothetical protein